MARLELWRGNEREVITLEGSRLSVGQLTGNDVALDDDTVSRLHGVFEEFRAGWSVRDLSSRNGTYINGDRIFGERALRDGDEVRMGRHRLVYRADRPELSPATAAPESVPELTARERDVLIALCRPLLAGDVFTEPASIRDISASLSVTEAAVKQHLARLYDKFSVFDRGERRRVRLANEAMRRGAISYGDLIGPDP